MYKKAITFLFAAGLLASCGTNPYVRAGSGAAIGAGTALAVNGDVLVGAAAGAGIGYLTNKNTVDFGDEPKAPRLTMPRLTTRY